MSIFPLRCARDRRTFRSGHFFCQSCFVEYHAAQLKARGVHRGGEKVFVPCPLPSCDETLRKIDMEVVPMFQREIRGREKHIDKE